MVSWVVFELGSDSVAAEVVVDLLVGEEDTWILVVGLVGLKVGFEG